MQIAAKQVSAFCAPIAEGDPKCAQIPSSYETLHQSTHSSGKPGLAWLSPISTVDSSSVGYSKNLSMLQPHFALGFSPVSACAWGFHR